MIPCERCQSPVPGAAGACPHCGAAAARDVSAVRPALAALLLGLAACNGDDPPDQALYGVAVVDADEDGWNADQDCDDDDPDVNPDADEIPGDGIDNDCDPSTAD